jgi:hypothetical protein
MECLIISALRFPVDILLAKRETLGDEARETGIAFREGRQKLARPVNPFVTKCTGPFGASNAANLAKWLYHGASITG